MGGGGGLLLFLIAMLHKHAHAVGVAGARLHRAASSLVRMVEIWENSGRVLSPADRQEPGKKQAYLRNP